MSTDLPVAIIGANGFVGSRLVEWLHLTGAARVRPVVRQVSSLARLARFDLDWRLADACDSEALTHAITGCDTLVHTMVGNPAVIETAARTLIPAAARAGVRRVVYLSTASVHGQSPVPGTDETSPLSDRQDVAYNNAKVRAERILFRDATRLGVELIALRPSIVFGPRDRWVTELAAELHTDTAWLINAGLGVCNSIYVDNLVHAIHRSLLAPSAAAGRAYLLTDAEPVTWRRLLEETRDLLPLPHARIHFIDAPVFPAPGRPSPLATLRTLPLARRLAACVPEPLKNSVKGALHSWHTAPRPTPWTLPAAPRPRPTKERVRLQQCTWQLPSAEARVHLGYAPPVDFSTGLARTVEWLRWSGRTPPPAP